MGNALNILIIDGNEADRHYYARRLNRSSPDYVIYEAATAREGLKVYSNCFIDCVVLELDLPDMSGFAVLTKLVPLAQHPALPVLILTRLNFRSLMELAILNGARLCLCKDMVSGDLLDTAILHATSAIQRDRKRLGYSTAA